MANSVADCERMIAETVERHLKAEGISVTFMQEADGAWAVRFGPVDREAMLAVLNSVVW